MVPFAIGQHYHEQARSLKQFLPFPFIGILPDLIFLRMRARSASGPTRIGTAGKHVPAVPFMQIRFPMRTVAACE
jgi:hypothetical protein